MTLRSQLPALMGMAVFAAACGSAPASTTSGPEQVPTQVRVGYLANLTHAPALVGFKNGYFAGALGSQTEIRTSVFNAGPDAQEAILSDSVDMTFFGPNPAINSFVQSHGEAIRVISGSTSGGASLVVRKGITSAADLKGKKLATPQLGNTQDISLRWWLKQQGLQTSATGGGDVNVMPQDNATTLQTFKAGHIDGAWVPEPWATRLVQEGGGSVLVDERSLWPSGKFATTVLAVRTDFLQKYPTTVKKFLAGLVKTINYLNSDPADAQKVANQAINDITNKKLADGVVTAAWGNMTFTVDPVASSLVTDAGHATQLGLLPSADLKGIYDLRLLNQVLAAAGQPAVSST